MTAQIDKGASTSRQKMVEDMSAAVGMAGLAMSSALVMPGQAQAGTATVSPGMDKVTADRVFIGGGLRQQYTLGSAVVFFSTTRDRG